MTSIAHNNETLSINMVLKVHDNLVPSRSMSWHNGNTLHLYLGGACSFPGWDTSYLHWGSGGFLSHSRQML
jgi:hypothetical protein